MAGAPMSQAAADLGLGDLLQRQQQNETEEERRKRLLMEQQRSLLSPAATALGMGPLMAGVR